MNGVGRFDWSSKGIRGELNFITSSFDRSVTGMDISDDGKTVYLTAADAARSRIFSVPAKGGPVKTLDPESRGVYSGIGVAGNH